MACGLVVAFVTAPRSIGRATPAMRAFQFPGMATASPEAERAFAAFAADYPEAVARGDYLGLPADKPGVTARFQALEQLLGPEAALDIVERDVRVLLFKEEYVANAWNLIKAKEQPGGITALSVVKKNPGLLTCEAYGLDKESLDSLDRTANIIDALRPLGLGQNSFFVVATFGFVLFLVALRVIGKALAPLIDPLLAFLNDIPKPLTALGNVINPVLDGAS